MNKGFARHRIVVLDDTHSMKPQYLLGGFILVKKKWAKKISFLLFASVLVAGCGVQDSDTYDMLNNEREDFVAIVKEKYAGYFDDEGYMVLGSYEQNGYDDGVEPIQWEILDINENGILLVSHYLLDYRSYMRFINIDEDEDITWEKSDLREWLNNDFYNMAFSDEERAIIKTVKLDNACLSEESPDTYDNVFMLGIDEIQRYFVFNSWEEDESNGMGNGYCQALLTEPTAYAFMQAMGYFYTPERAMQKVTHIDEMDYSVLESKGYTRDCLGKIKTTWMLRSEAGNNMISRSIEGHKIVPSAL
ncbi:MAG: hypothetical protein IJ600_01175 [Lachnospiraceae bacterium]|nr:hypothetical protein [Lachnospiraceae bacterium]